ncbi:hypothetical protein [Actinoplanes friuliensis]|uniref:Uncharacterized protein n=1 Tax=Actinoplanes friuliensis DSM 7358 TaxID=1246995 RepID=U5W748_9ACTN|nr:hypothetical protein [Actinoplanes friuliensis]AGZ44827.1 hypothetical protein AFR_32845 [Actinoplanes friuliensis DSM 7358]
MNEVVFPRTADGRRSSSALGRAVVADALRVADPAAAAAAEGERDWRKGYLRPFRALVEAGLDSGYDLARAGLDSVHERMRVVRDGEDVPLAEAFDIKAEAPPTVTVTGEGSRERELAIPYRGELLRGDTLHRQLDRWVERGVIEASCAEMVREVAAEPDWLNLSDQRIVVLGAGAEMGPLPAVLAWGGTVVGLDLPRPQLWARVAGTARKSAGTLIAPGSSVEDAGIDLLTGLPAAASWLLEREGRLVLGNYVYAPGAAYARLSAAVDALGVHVREQRPETALAFLATPTDAFAVPGDAVAQATSRFRERSAAARTTGALSGGRLLQPNYPEGADPGIADSLVPQQGPNYALAKRIQRWRASVSRQDGVPVSFSVAPPTRTRSVTSNRLLAAAYAGAHLFGVEIFAPATSNRLMAALMVHQLRKPRPAAPSAWVDETVGAAHGGLWRTAYQPRTALGLAAVRGLPAAVR